jgi:hypothetical protein
LTTLACGSLRGRRLQAPPTATDGAIASLRVRFELGTWGHGISIHFRDVPHSDALQDECEG